MTYFRPGSIFELSEKDDEHLKSDLYHCLGDVLTSEQTKL